MAISLASLRMTSALTPPRILIHGVAGVVEGGITRAAAPLALGVGAGGEVFFNDLAQEV